MAEGGRFHCWASDLWVYLRNTTRRIPLALASVAGVILAVVSSIHHHSIGLPAWAWGLIAVLGIVLDGFTEWRKLYVYRVTPEHAEKIRDIAEHLFGQVNRGWFGLDYPDGEDGVLKEMFQGHYPELFAQLGEWNDLGNEILRNTKWAQERISVLATAKIHARFSVNDGWMTGSMIEQITHYATRNKGIVKNDNFPEISCVADAVRWGNLVLNTVTDQFTEVVARAGIETLKRMTVEVVQDWPTDELQRLSDRRDEIARETLRPLQLVFQGDSIPPHRCPGCPRRYE